MDLSSRYQYNFKSRRRGERNDINLRNIISKFWRTPKRCERRSKRVWWSTVWKAAKRSNRSSITQELLSMARNLTNIFFSFDAAYNYWNEYKKVPLEERVKNGNNCLRRKLTKLSISINIICLAAVRHLPYFQMWLANMFLRSAALNWCIIAVNKPLLGFSIFSTASKHREDLEDMGVFLHLFLISAALPHGEVLSCPDGRFQILH